MEEYSKMGRLKLSIVAYSLTFITGIAVALPFVVKASVSHDFKSNLTYTGTVFALFMLGMLVAQLSNGFIIKFISLKAEIYLIALLYICCLIAMYLVPTISAMIPVLLVLGFGFGALVTIPFYIIAHSFEGHQRSVGMNLLDLFFAIGSFCFPIIAGQLLARHFDWKTLYLIVMIVWVFIVIVLTFTKLPNVNLHHTDKGEAADKFSPWTFNVYLIGLAIFLAFTSFMGFNYWVVTFLTDYLHIAIDVATLGISCFWGFYGLGCLVASIVLVKFKVNSYIMLSALIAFVSYFFIFYATGGTMMLISISVLGLGCSTIYGSSISFGSLILENPSPRLISFFITASGIGTYAGEFYSSFVQEHFGIPTIIVLSGIFMLLVFLLILYVSISENMKPGPKKSFHE